MVSVRHFGTSAEMSGHFGTIIVVPKCLRSEVSWVPSVLTPVTSSLARRRQRRRVTSSLARRLARHVLVRPLSPPRLLAPVVSTLRVRAPPPFRLCT